MEHNFVYMMVMPIDSTILPIESPLAHGQTRAKLEALDHQLLWGCFSCSVELALRDGVYRAISGKYIEVMSNILMQRGMNG